MFQAGGEEFAARRPIRCGVIFVPSRLSGDLRLCDQAKARRQTPVNQVLIANYFEDILGLRRNRSDDGNRIMRQHGHLLCWPGGSSSAIR